MKKFIFFCLFLYTSVNLSAQNLLYSESFVDGFPNGWNTENILSAGGLWTYCNAQGATHTNTCPMIWDDVQNDQDAFESTSSDNGFLVMDSDQHGKQNNYANHNSYVQTDAFNFVLSSQVWLKFEYQFGSFFTFSNNTALVEVSSDGTNWEPFQIKPIAPGLNPYPGFVRWSRNPEIMIIDISSAAAGQNSVFIRWRWEAGNEYYWAIDDIAIYDADPKALWLPENDLEVLKYIATAPNFKTPSSQMESFGFQGDFLNHSYLEKENVTFKGTIKDNDGTQLFEDSVNVNTVPADDIIPNILFPGDTPVFSEIGSYTGEYEVYSNELDETPLNNSRLFYFEVTEGTFAKEPSSNDGIVPALDAWDDDEPRNWGWGNIFYVPNGEGYKAKGISFVFLPINNMVTYEDIIGIKLEAILYEWNNTNNDNIVQENEMNVVSLIDYFVDGTENSQTPVHVEFFDDSSLLLKDDTYYIPMIVFKQTSATEIRIGSYNFFDYGSMIQRSDSVGAKRFASALWIDSEGNKDFDTFGFGYDVVPVVRLEIEPLVGTRDIHDQNAELINIFPNPALDYIQIENKGLAMGNVKDILIQINSTDGKLIDLIPWGNNQNYSQTISIADLVPGSYHLVIGSKSSGQQITKTLVVGE